MTQISNPGRGRSGRFVRRLGAPLALVIALCGGVFTAPLDSASAATPSATSGLDLARYKGKVVYLDFWASWCGPCKLSFPFMERINEIYSRGDFVMIAVNVDHERAKADAFLEQVGPHPSVIYDPKGELARRFDVKAMPTSVLIGPDGQVRYVHTGFFQAQIPLYEAHISELLHGH